MDLRGQDLDQCDLSGADLRGANLSGLRLTGTNLSDADLTDADFSGARLAGGSLRGANLAGSRWADAAILGTDGAAELAAVPELAAAAMAGRDPVQVVISTDDPLTSVMFSPDGTLLVTASASGAIRTWDIRTGTLRDAGAGGDSEMRGQPAAFSPDETMRATASGDGAARLWQASGLTEPAEATLIATLVALPDGGYAVLLPDGRYKLDGDPAESLWWEIKTCRFAPRELDPYVKGITIIAADVPVTPAREGESQPDGPSPDGR
jgi:hypothetical protein